MHVHLSGEANFLMFLSSSGLVGVEIRKNVLIIPQSLQKLTSAFDIPDLQTKWKLTFPFCEEIVFGNKEATQRINGTVCSREAAKKRVCVVREAHHSIKCSLYNRSPKSNLSFHKSTSLARNALHEVNS